MVTPSDTRHHAASHANGAEYDRQTCFPWKLVDELIDILKQRGADFITFADVCLPNGARPLSREAAGREYVAWKYGVNLPIPYHVSYALSRIVRDVSIKRGIRTIDAFARPRRLQVLLHHDADRQPYKTIDMMRLERDRDVTSSNFFFFERHMWDEDAEPYDVDVKALQSLESNGFEIGYHLNGYELAGYDLVKARAIVVRDVAWFRERFNLRTFVPHGGTRGPGGLNNVHFPHEGPLADLVWGYDLRGVIVDSRWSDGSVESAAVSDPRMIAKKAPDGSRLHFLMHPQYYGERLAPVWLNRPIAQQRWWRDLWGLA